jgi:UDP-N-acetylmuramoylalanine--D-glutamate ligase
LYFWGPRKEQSSEKEKYKKELAEKNIEFEEGQHSLDKILNADEVIKSPGIAEKTDIIQKIIERNIINLQMIYGLKNL